MHFMQSVFCSLEDSFSFTSDLWNKQQQWYCRQWHNWNIQWRYNTYHTLNDHNKWNHPLSWNIITMSRINTYWTDAVQKIKTLGWAKSGLSEYDLYAQILIKLSVNIDLKKYIKSWQKDKGNWYRFAFLAALEAIKISQCK